MRKYKIKLHYQQIQYLHESLNQLIVHPFILGNIDEHIFYNIKSLIRSLYLKLYQLSDTRVDNAYQYKIAIDINQHQALKEVYEFVKEDIEKNMYLQIVYYQVFSQCDKQKTDSLTNHLYLNKPLAIVQRKLNSDNLKQIGE